MGISTILTFLALIGAAVASVFISRRKVPMDEMDYLPSQTPDLTPQSPPPAESVEVPVQPVQTPVEAQNPLTTLLPWTTQRNYFHNVRVLCDRAGLTLAQKNIVCACIYVESQFRDYKSNGTPVINWNKDPATGHIWSTDYGLVQVNDYWQIEGHGKGHRFPSVAYVLAHPEKTAGWMIETMKATGKLQPWASYTTGVYKQHLLASSPMWFLRS